MSVVRMDAGCVMKSLHRLGGTEAFLMSCINSDKIL